MKKRICLFLALVMVLGLCACAQKEEPPAPLEVGYSKVDITPILGGGLDGYSDSSSRRATDVVEPIYATCIAVTQGEQTILLFTIDTTSMAADTAEMLRVEVTDHIDVPGENVFFGGTHGHNCPSKDNAYKLQLRKAVAKAAQEAMDDRAVATMLTAKPEFPGMNFVRHYEMSDGTYSGSNFGTFKADLVVGHAGENDPNGVLIQFDREGKKDILMVNWQAHPDSARQIGYTSICPSWIGPLRDTAEQLTGMHVAYFTGASGNQNKDSKIASEANGLTWQEYGEKMGQLIYEALPQLQPVDSNGIKTSRVIFDAEVDHSWDHMLAEANEVYGVWKTQGKKAGDALGKTYNFTSSYQARAIRSRANMGPTRPLQLNVFCIGDVGFTTGTYEMFSDSGLYVKRNSPFETTFIITGNSSYLPTEQAYDYRSYEADTGYFARGTAEKLAVKYVEMLEGIR